MWPCCAGGRPLFDTAPNGRGTTPRSTFMGYVAVGQDKDKRGGIDVALVWRGTIFREEWVSHTHE